MNIYNIERLQTYALDRTATGIDPYGPWRSQTTAHPSMCLLTVRQEKYTHVHMYCILFLTKRKVLYSGVDKCFISEDFNLEQANVSAHASGLDM
jgi:hypothetical protein